MPPAKRKASEPVNEPAKQGQESGSGIYLDPKLAEIRDAEAKRNDVAIAPREDASIDEALVKAREVEIKRGDRKINL